MKIDTYLFKNRREAGYCLSPEQYCREMILSRIHDVTPLAPIVISARYFVQSYVIGFLVT